MPTLSTRGLRLADQPLRPDFKRFDQAMRDRYDREDNPSGIITLCIAENLLSWPMVRDRLQQPLRNGVLPEWVASYAPIAGHPELREAVAGFLTRHVTDVPLEADRLAMAAGATATIELTAMLLADPGDVCLFPAPAYQVYAHDIGAKGGVKQDHLHGPLTQDSLDRKKAEHGDRLRMLVLTSPNNPTGEIYPEATLRFVAGWCRNNKVHLIVNEIYALSQFTGDYDVPYVSFLRVLEEMDSPYLHWWYSFSKDFGISGLRVGALYTRNDDLLTGMGNLAAPHQVSNPTQFMLADLLRDDEWVTRFKQLNRERLTAAYRKVTDLLDEYEVPYAPARGSLFVWMDLSGYLGHPSSRHYPEEEGPAHNLWDLIIDEYGLLLTAPQGFGQREDGWFRLVYSCVEPATLEAALGRLREFLAGSSGQ